MAKIIFHSKHKDRGDAKQKTNFIGTLRSKRNYLRLNSKWLKKLRLNLYFLRLNIIAADQKYLHLLYF
jgi:hypothetical protein